MKPFSFLLFKIYYISIDIIGINFYNKYCIVAQISKLKRNDYREEKHDISNEVKPRVYFAE